MKENIVIGPVRSISMEGIGKVSKRPLWSRQDAVRSIEGKRKFDSMIDGFRIQKSPVRIARVKRIKNGYHIVGFGKQIGFKMSDVRNLLKENGYTGICQKEKVVTI